MLVKKYLDGLNAGKSSEHIFFLRLYKSICNYNDTVYLFLRSIKFGQTTPAVFKSSSFSELEGSISQEKKIEKGMKSSIYWRVVLKEKKLKDTIRFSP